MPSKLEKLCNEKNIKLTDNRKVILQVIANSNDHPDVEEVFKRASQAKPGIGVATVYRTVKILEEEGIITKHDFGEGKFRYEEFDECDHHDHLIDITNNKVIEFYNEEIEKLKEKIALEYGYKLVDHRLELYAVPLSKSSK